MSSPPDLDLITIISTYYEIKNVKWLWYADYYDGPCGGMVESDGKKYWALWYQNFEGRRVFVLFKLTQKQQKAEEFWHQLNELCSSKDEAESKFYRGRYNLDYEELDLKQKQIVGWFRE